MNEKETEEKIMDLRREYKMSFLEVLSQYSRTLETELLKAREEIAMLKEELKQAWCSHSFDVSGVCELCGLNYNDNPYESEGKGDKA